jgi:hypothetical protein
MNTSQNRDILAALQAGDSLTHRDAEARFGCTRLAARISDLRNGQYKRTRHDIRKRMEKNAAGNGYHARYWMPKADRLEGAEGY